MRLIFLILAGFISFHLAYTQQVNYKLIDLPTISSQIRTDTFTIYSNTEITNDVFFILGIKPHWTNVAGLSINNQLVIAYIDSINDGNLENPHFYLSEKDTSDFIIITTYSFEDGASAMAIFEYNDKKIRYLGKVSLLVKGVDQYAGTYGYFSKDFISVSTIRDTIKLNFAEGEYLYLEDYKEKTISGPIEVIYNGDSWNMDNRSSSDR